MPLLPRVEPDHLWPRVTSARLLAACFDLAVGLRLLWPDEILGGSPSYAYLQQHFIGDVPLGIALLLFGGAMFASLYGDRAGELVDVAHWLSLLTWLLVAIDIGRVSISQIGSLVYGLVAVLNGFAYWHLRLWRRQLAREHAP